LVVVDDGSTDSTEDVVKHSGIQARYIRTEHGGVSAARNIGIRSSAGEYIAFLDSDDAWDPSYLSVCAAFLDANPQESLISTELLVDFGGGRRTVHPYLRLKDWYPPLAKRVDSHSLDLPAGESDPYMRIFSFKIDITDWLNTIRGEPAPHPVFRYRGDIFPHFRWGYLFSIVSTLFRRTAIEQAGVFDESLSSGEDFLFLAKICRHCPANFIGWPGLIKHEFDPDGHATLEGHLATSGQRMVQFQINQLRCVDTLYGAAESKDAEMRKIRGYWLYTVGHHALIQGDSQLAQSYLTEALQFFPGYGAARIALLVARILPGASGKYYGMADRMLGIGGRLVHGKLNVRGFLRRLVR